MSDGVKHVLVTGGNGQLGTELKRYAWPKGWAVTAIDIDELDLRDTAAIAGCKGRRNAPCAASQPFADMGGDPCPERFVAGS